MQIIWLVDVAPPTSTKTYFIFLTMRMNLLEIATLMILSNLTLSKRSQMQNTYYMTPVTMFTKRHDNPGGCAQWLGVPQGDSEVLVMF